MKKLKASDLVNIHRELIDELRAGRVDKLSADAVCTQSSRILNALRLQKDVSELVSRGKDVPDDLKEFSGIE